MAAMTSLGGATSQDLESAIQTCRDLQHLAKSASANGGTVPNGVKIVSGLLLQHIQSADLVQVASQSLASVLTGVPHAPALLRLEGGVKACVAALQNHHERSKVAAPIVKVLARLCSNSAMTAVAFVKEKHSMDSLLRAIGAHLADHTVVAPACDLLVGLSRHEKCARLIPASDVAYTLRDVMVGYLGRWDVCSASLRVLKNLSKCEETRLLLLRSTECTKLLLGVSRILARLPERRKLFKRAYRTLWLLFQSLLPPLPYPDVRADRDVSDEPAEQPLPDEEMERALFPESNLGSAPPEPDAYSPEDEFVTRVRACVVDGKFIPDQAAAERSGQNPAMEGYHSDGDVLVARAMLHELERIMHPSRVRFEVVYDDNEGPLVSRPLTVPSSPAGSRPCSRSGETPPLWESEGSKPSTPDLAELGASADRGALRSRPPSFGRRAVTTAGLGGRISDHAISGVGSSGGGVSPGRRLSGGGVGTVTEMAAAAIATATALEGRSRGSGTGVKAATPAETPPLIFESRFESGNLRQAVRVYDREYDLHLAPDCNDPEGRCQWFFLSLQGAVAGLPYKFNVVNLGKKDSLYNMGLRPLLCYRDQTPRAEDTGNSASGALQTPVGEGGWKEWLRAGEDVCYYPAPYRTHPGMGRGGTQPRSHRRRRGSVKGGNKGGGGTDDGEGRKGVGSGLYGCTFTLQLETSGLYYLCMCYPYTYTDLQTYIRNMLFSRGATSLRSGRQMVDICRRSILCKTLKGHRVDALTITDFASLADLTSSEAPGLYGVDRPYVVISARVHPGETNASWMMKGILDFLLSDSPLAERLRCTYVFKCVPMLNPDGVINGSYRCSLAGVDLNRCWGNPNKKRHPPIHYCKRMIDRVARSGRLVLFCDLHGHSRKEDVFVYGCEPYRGREVDRDCIDPREEAEARARVRLLPYLIARQNPCFVLPKCSFKVSKSKLGTGRVVVCRELGVPNSYTIEASLAGASYSGRHMTARDFEEMGHAFCRALADATDAIEKGEETEMELLADIDSACGVGLAAATGRQQEATGGDSEQQLDSDESGED
ncbi:hypothetical protein CYMTET_9280 [Cymbomonas tetramitiformis]|uniref:tubulin-glutamate carboxypeptidase n=1 Tax=Cymbomonas tetramitiformis TaxID=36881 RepID=A0AAE0LF99_9CHLO|nr:hypothetical protein CYMTET_9280 [Cymbomonas tetramitiformis]